MKVKVILFFVFFSVAGIATAQNDIPNQGFENWSDGEPAQWNTFDQEILGTEFDMVTEENDAPYQGNASVKMETISQYVFPVGDITMPGLITLGEVDIDPINEEGGIYGGTPYADNPQSLSGYYKYFPAEGDSSALGMVLYKWNGESRDTLGGAALTLEEEVSEWTQFETYVEYNIWDTPDTMNIIASSTAIEDDTPEGSVLYLDELTLNYGPTSIIEPDFKAEIRVYPESYSQRFRIHLESDSMIEGAVQVFNLQGQLLKSKDHQFYNSDAYISYSDLSSGVYIISVVTENGRKFNQKVEIH